MKFLQVSTNLLLHKWHFLQTKSGKCLHYKFGGRKNSNKCYQRERFQGSQPTCKSGIFGLMSRKSRNFLMQLELTYLNEQPIYYIIFLD